jgi:hypothetical protein
VAIIGDRIVKTLGADLGRFNDVTERIYAHGSTPTSGGPTRCSPASSGFALE